MLSRARRDVADAQRGSVLILMPAAALIFVILGSLAVDATALFLAERELAGAAAAAANDAATRALDLDLFYEAGCLTLDERLAEDVAARSVSAKRLGQAGLRVATPEVRVGGREVRVTLTAAAPHIFTKAIPGAPDTATVSATATATAEGPGAEAGVGAGCGAASG